RRRVSLKRTGPLTRDCWSRTRVRTEVSIVPEDALTGAKPGATPIVPGPRHRPRPWTLPGLGLLVIVAAGWAWWQYHGGASATTAARKAHPPGPAASWAGAALRVEGARPRRGGLGRAVVQPGFVRALEKASLYAKVSGYLVPQVVDIGDSIKKGQVLPR